MQELPSFVSVVFAEDFQDLFLGHLDQLSDAFNLGHDVSEIVPRDPRDCP